MLNVHGGEKRVYSVPFSAHYTLNGNVYEMDCVA